MLATGRLLAVQLRDQTEVAYRLPPAVTRSVGRARGGLLRVIVPVAGVHRLALSSAHWVDVLDGGQRLRLQNSETASGCRTPRKLLRVRLPAGRPLLIQLSGAADAELRLTLTPEP